MIKLLIALIFTILIVGVNKILSFYYNLFFFFRFIYCFIYIHTYNEVWINLRGYFGVDYYSYFLNLLRIWVLGLILITLINKESDVKVLIFIRILIIILILFSIINLLLFYFIFEIRLIPTFILVLYWGVNPERIRASLYLLIYTLFISIPLLVYLFKLIENLHRIRLRIIYLVNSINLSLLEYYIYILSFWIKIPMYAFHIWLPKAHVEAPVYGSIVLAAVLLKLGRYGLIRLIYIFINETFKYNYYIIRLSLIGSLLTRLICLVQIDIKSLVAYSSVVHINLILSTIIIITKLGFIGSYIIIISHGLCSSGLFYAVNLFYRRTRSRLIIFNKGIINLIPSIIIWWFILCIFNFSFPISLNFVSEIFIISVIVKWEVILILYLIVIRFVSRAYSLYLYSYVSHGELYLTNYINRGEIKEILVLILHVFPVVLIIFNLVFWI